MRKHRLPSQRGAAPATGRWVPALLLALILCLVWYGGEPSELADRLNPGEMTSATVTTDGVNLRTGPSVAHPVVTVLGKGDVVTLTGITKGDFLLVLSDTTSGWAASEYLEGGGEPGPRAQAMDVTTIDSPADAPESTSNGPPDESTSLEPGLNRERWIRIDRSEASVSLLQGDELLAVFPGRIGRDPSVDGFYATAVGTFSVYAMNKQLAPTPFAEDTWLTDWVGFDPVRRNGIHSPVRASDGTEREWQNETTLGCVRLSAEDAEKVFEFARIGMRVEVVD